MNIPSFIRRILWKRLLAGMLAGGIAGFAYWYFVGCNTGTCPLKSNLWIMTGYGIFAGGLLFFKVRESSAAS